MTFEADSCRPEPGFDPASADLSHAILGGTLKQFLKTHADFFSKFDAEPEYKAKLMKSMLDSRHEQMLRDRAMFDVLTDHGWKWEAPYITQKEPWQWFWRRPSKAAEFGQHVLQRKKNLIVNFRRRRNRASKAWEKIAKIGPGPQRSYLAGVRDTWQKAMEIAQQL